MDRVELTKQFARFFVVGFSAFLIDAGLLSFQVFVLEFNPFIEFRLLGLLVSISIANAFSVLVALFVSFWLQRMWTFKSTNNNIAREGGRFAAVTASTYILNNLVYGFFVVSIGLHELVAKVLVTGLQMVWSFTLYKLVVFKPH